MSRPEPCFARLHERANDVLFAVVLTVAAVCTGIVTWSVAGSGVEAAVEATAGGEPLTLELPRVEIIGERAGSPG